MTAPETRPVTGVLLVPADEDPLGLLREGPCEARPPMAWLLSDGSWTDSSAVASADPLHLVRPGPRALVLASAGKPVLEGDAWARLRGGNWWSDTPRRIRAYLAGDYSAAHVVDPRLGTVVLIDRARRELVRKTQDGIGAWLEPAGREVSS